jgi:DUF4097 and DUF4098 domain-containing protein YvlB
MHIRLTSAFIIPAVLLPVSVASAQSTAERIRQETQQAVRRAAAEAREYYQGRRGPEQSDTLSRKFRIGRDGAVSISNIAGTITVTATSGDEVSIDAVKRGYGDRSDLNRVNVIVDERPGRVEVRTEHSRSLLRGSDDISVDYTVAVPAGVSLDVFSVSGRIRVSGVKGSARLGSVSGDVTSADTPRLEYVRTVSGEVELAGISHDSSLSLSSVSGNIRVTGLKARSVDLNTVSGEVTLRDASCERLNARGVSGNFEYAGTLLRNGRYEVNSHSGDVRFNLTGSTGFELNATSFAGSVRSDYPMTVGGDRNPEVRGRGRRGGPGTGMRATYADGSASLNLRTFSGSIVIAKR